MLVHSIFTILHEKITRRSFLRHSATLISTMAMSLAAQKKRLVAATGKRPLHTDAARRPSDSLYFAVIGDYGKEDRDVSRVASMVRSWEPDFITTVGDNIYGYESFKTVDDCIGQYFRRFLSPYNGEYGEDSGVNRFYPILGNHDWESVEVDEQGNCIGPYFDFFPDREPYYTFQQGPVRFFMLDSYRKQPAGNTPLSKQAMWLRDQLAQSDATWNLVYLHHSPYSSGTMHGSHPHLQWPFAQWGADAVLSGHNHTYERIEHDGIMYFVNGLGGTSQHALHKPRVAGSQAGATGTFGAQLIAVNEELITFQFFDRDERQLDVFTKYKQQDETDAQGEPGTYSPYEVKAFHRRVSSATDAGFERLVDGPVLGQTMTASEQLLDFDSAGSGSVAAGCRFADIPIPRHTKILDVRIEFTASERNSGPASIQIHAEKDCYADSYQGGNQLISQRAKTVHSVEWNDVEAWTKVGASYWTPNLAEIVQEIVDQYSWSEGNTIAFTFSGQGRRPSVAYDLQPLAAPRLHVTYGVLILSDSQQVRAAHDVDNADEIQKVYLPSIATMHCDIPDE